METITESPSALKIWDTRKGRSVPFRGGGGGVVSLRFSGIT